MYYSISLLNVLINPKSVFFIPTSTPPPSTMPTTISKLTTATRHHLLRRHLSTTTTPTIDPAVKLLVRSRRLSEVEPHITHLLSSADPSPDETLFSSAILSYGYAKMLDHASRTFHLVPNPTPLSLNALLTSFSHSKTHLPQVPHLFSHLTSTLSITPNTTTYSILIKSHCDSGSPDDALLVLARMRSTQTPLSVVTYTPIIDSLYARRRPDEAEKLWAEMVDNGCTPDVAAYNVRLSNYARRGTPEDVLKVFDEMRGVGLEPDVVGYNYLIGCYCRNGLFLDAKKVFGELKGKGVEPNAAKYRSFVGFLCKNGDFGFALKLCKEGMRKGVLVDIAPAKRLVKGLVKGEKREDAVWLVRQLKEKYPPTLKEAIGKVEVEFGLGVDGDGSTAGGMDTAP